MSELTLAEVQADSTRYGPPGGPDADSRVFIALRPTKAVILRNDGIGGRHGWRAS